ncbi:MAG: GIY-YIG nuclease family protein [Chitinophagaceae bacterium]|nr:MAG: GIY-YIG nuclease family protein [Chitinophagaceae bacterium]
MKKGGFVYILTNLRRTVLYIGVSSDLKRRLREHVRHRDPESFTARYNCTCLVYFETFPGIAEAIRREKVLKEWTRERKLGLICSSNPNLDFYDPDTLQLLKGGMGASGPHPPG